MIRKSHWLLVGLLCLSGTPTELLADAARQSAAAISAALADSRRPAD
jgi:hypothetical protein